MVSPREAASFRLHPTVPAGYMGALSQPRRRPMQRLHQRLRREWLCQIGETPGLMRSLASGGAVVSGDVDDRHGNVRFFKMASYLDTRNIAQVDVEKNANQPVEIAVICEGFRRGKQHACVAQLPQQSRYALQHHGVVIDDENKVPLGQAGHLDFGKPVLG